MAGITEAMFGELSQEKKRVASLKTCHQKN